ncbi:MAG: hypothetical protein UW92_C0019G0008 [Candidatus Jorgensenbacteria bacterium GW2011_GWA2_45_13]|uniref:Uncharacterized protein n=1 Tax=Candidatus Jorgensenbacteria bacterium GW2011_GWA2_45_13 TaxID=1618662 RepID=A0A0G1L5G2_9BACT|nr:MAG: hypothetical protein UW92_C0019G0008 [Candidatus Jorgensenbacteria bacterium GW2011_GWA2_45_13]
MILYILILGLIIWYLFYGLECFINGGTIGKSRFFFPFECLWNEILWNLPGGKETYVKKHIANSSIDTAVCGSKQVWRSAEIRKKNLYFECGKDILPGFFHLFLVVSIPFGLSYAIILFISHL